MLTVGVLGVLGPNTPLGVIPPLGVPKRDPKPPGEKSPFEVGDCNHARTERDKTES